ncbi:hypothetical protein HYV73_04240 [Candidatus Uhrbacteria bacterium]|nr:hypothetical protein [Candidatus Uhrbacteria bacterium]
MAVSLLIDGHDIRWIFFAIIAEGGGGRGEVKGMQQVFAEPEGFLGALDGFLNRQGEKLPDVDALYAVPGPGSFTACRTSIALVNGIAWTRSLPLFSIPPLSAPTVEDVRDALAQAKPVLLPLAPAYDRPPTIT